MDSRKCIFASFLVALNLVVGGCQPSPDAVALPTESGIELARLPVAGATTHDADSLGAVSPGWPHFLGPRRDGVSRERDIRLDWGETGPQELWRSEIGTGYSSPVVAGDDLILMHRLCDEEFVECFHAGSGESKWRCRYPTSYACAYAYSDGPYSTPAIDNGLVYAWSAEGSLRCLELSSGDPIWQRDLNVEYDAELGMFPVAGSVFVENGRVILNVGGMKSGAGVVALDKLTGETLWTTSDHGPGDATAVAATIHGSEYIFMFTEEGLLSLDPPTGKTHWQIPFRAKAIDTSNATTPAIWNDIVLISAYKVGGLGLRILPDGSYEELWRERRNLMCQYQNLIVRDGYVYGFSAQDHTLRCLDMRTGEVQWKWEPEYRRGQMLAVGETLLIIFETGHLAAVDVSPHGWSVRSLTSKPVVQNRCFSSPALSNGRLYLRSDSDVACLQIGG